MEWLHAAQVTTVSPLSLNAADSDKKPQLASLGPASQALKGRWDRQEPNAQLASEQQPKVAQSTLQQEVEGEGVRQELESVGQDSKPMREEQHDAHAATFSLEAVMEAQSALIHERQQKAQPNMSEDERKAHRRRQESLSVCSAKLLCRVAIDCGYLMA